MTAICGLANNFLTLLLARIGVGVGEAGASPPSHSLISDYFPIETRATALSIYALGIPLGTMIGSFVGGWGADTVGWRYTFFLVGVPGIIFAFIVWFTLREPPRGMSDIKLDAPSAPPVNTAPPPPVSTVLTTRPRLGYWAPSREVSRGGQFGSVAIATAAVQNVGRRSSAEGNRRTWQQRYTRAAT